MVINGLREYFSVLLLLGCLFPAIAGASQANPESVFDLLPELPRSLGRVTQRFDPADRKPVRSVFLIQDVHSNYTTQKNIAGILNYLAQVGELPLILVEGGSGKASLAFLRQEGTPTSRRSLAERFLREGIFTGYEYADIVGDREWSIWGVEEQDLYDLNFRCFVETKALGPQLTSYADWMNRTVEILSQRMLSRDLLLVRDSSRILAKDQSQLPAYIRRLVGLWEESGHSIDSFPMLAQFSQRQQPPRPIESFSISDSLTGIERLRVALEDDLARSPPEKEIVELGRIAMLINKLALLKWSPSDFAAYQVARSKSDAASWLMDLQRLAAASDLPRIEQSAVDRFPVDLEQAARFYAAAELRNTAIAENALKRMQAEDASSAALIIGGFHSEQVSRQLVEAGLRVIVITPAVGMDTDPDRYTADILRKRQPWRPSSLLDRRLSRIPESGPAPR